MQLLQLIAKRSLQLRQGGGLQQAPGGPWMLLDLQRAVNFVKTVRHPARVRNLRKRDQISRGVVPPLGSAFGAANGNRKIFLRIFVARDETVELRLRASENEVGHVDPGHEFIRIGNVAGASLVLKSGPRAF